MEYHLLFAKKMIKNRNKFRQTNQESQVLLRCKKCGKISTIGKIVETPKGYRCRECIRQQQIITDINKPFEKIVVFLIATVLSFVGSLLVFVILYFLSILTFAAYFVVFLVAPVIGVGIAEVIKAVIKKRRGSRLNKLVSGGVIFGGAPSIIAALFIIWLVIINETFNIYSFLNLSYFIIYVSLAVRSCHNRLSVSRRH